MPQKTFVHPESIHESQLYGPVGTRSVQTYERTQVDEAAVADESAAVVARPGSISAQATMQMHRGLREQISGHDLAWRWECDTTQTFLPGQSSPIRFSNENVHGAGAKFVDGQWLFEPPPDKLGAYQVHAWINYLIGATQNCQHARMEVWVRRQGQWSRWSVVDALYANHGAPDEYTRIARVSMGRPDVVYLNCGDAMQFRAYHAMASPLGLAADSIYGHCSGHWLGCPPSPTDLDVQSYLIPEA